jgi:hypothetical protein
MTGRKTAIGDPQRRRPVRKSNPRSQKVIMKSPVQLSTLTVIAVLVLGAGALGWRFVSPSLTTAMVKVKVPELSAVALRGQQAFDANCASCHGRTGRADKGPPLVTPSTTPVTMTMALSSGRRIKASGAIIGTSATCRRCPR